MSDKTPEQIEAEEKAEKDKLEKEKKRKPFDEQQIDFVNGLVAKAFKDGAEKAEKALNDQIAAEKKERERLAADLAELKKKSEQEPSKEEKEKHLAPEIAAFNARLEEMQGVLAGIKTERDELKKRVDGADKERRKARKKDAFLTAMKDAEVSFFDPLEAYDLAEKMGYEWDEDLDRPVVMNHETKRPKLNENGEPMDAVDFIKDFASRKKYLVKAPQQEGGSGSGTVRTPEREQKKTEKPFAEMSEEEFRAYTEKVMSQR